MGSYYGVSMGTVLGTWISLDAFMVATGHAAINYPVFHLILHITPFLAYELPHRREIVSGDVF